MTTSSVEFPGNFRIHVALTVTDLAKAVRFYELLLGASPIKERPRYAKFEPQDPSVNLTLNEVDGDVSVEGGSAHFGIQVKSVEDVHSAIDRFQSAGIKTITEEATTCCYAVQDKVWAVDPDGHKWEVFVVLDPDAKDELYAEAGCCEPDLVTLNQQCDSSSATAD
ncbi:MAG TPA: glyoxalase/bleomycin resistance/dioxygenase family protein [Planctomycetaceae bacterium]|nr:glyoxalase/bleomycin resistance/dioxygenase family protein [Planctomycetaceae bacterium]